MTGHDGAEVITLPVPGAVAPAPGVGVTWRGPDADRPGTIFRAGPRVFWFRLDADGPAAAHLTDALRAWTFSAVRQADGTWRDADMRRVDVGVRRLRLHALAVRGVPGARSVDELAREVDRLEPSLLKRRWYPMTSMMIPGVLASADALLSELDAYAGPDRPRAVALRERLAALCAGFRRLS
jgi:hypothetical protein